MSKLSDTINRRKNGISNADLARQLDMPQDTLNRLLRDERGYGVPSLRKIATWARRNNDHVTLKAVIEHALGFELDTFYYIINDETADT